mgnify:CR=1 FL=1
MFAWREDDGPLTRLVTDRLGGASTGPYAEFNLGDHVGDAPEAVGANRGALAAAVDVPPDRLVFADQVHGRRVVAVEEPWGTQRPASADGLVSTSPDLVLGALVADCVPVLLADPQGGVIAAVHAGRPGMIARIVDAGIIRPLPRSQTAQELGANIVICQRDEMIDRLAGYAEMGIDEVIVTSIFGQPQQETLEMMSGLAEEVMPHLLDVRRKVA